MCQKSHLYFRSPALVILTPRNMLCLLVCTVSLPLGIRGERAQGDNLSILLQHSPSYAEERQISSGKTVLVQLGCFCYPCCGAQSYCRCLDTTSQSHHPPFCCLITLYLFLQKEQLLQGLLSLGINISQCLPGK